MQLGKRQVLVDDQEEAAFRKIGEYYAALTGLMDVQPPFVLYLGLVDVQGSCFMGSAYSDMPQPFPEPCVMSNPVDIPKISDPTEYSRRTTTMATMLREPLNDLWNAAGLAADRGTCPTATIRGVAGDSILMSGSNGKTRTLARKNKEAAEEGRSQLFVTNPG